MNPTTMIHPHWKPPDKALECLAGTYQVEGRHKVLLHGYLHIKIIKCTNLKNMDCNTMCAPSCLAPNDVSDPYVTVHAGDQRLAKTSLQENNLNPVWNEDFYVPLAHYVENLRFAVQDDDFNLYAQLIGETFLPVEELVKFDDEGKPLRVGVHKVAWLDHKPHHGSLEFFVDYVPEGLLTLKSMEVPGVYFQQHSGNRVKLYVNADDGTMITKEGEPTPKVSYGPRTSVSPTKTGVETAAPKQHEWEPQRLWKDVYEALCAAQHLIYITGWSVDVSQSLLRGPEKEEAIKNGKYSPYIGELLKQKADEGLTVNLLVWDDATSNIAMAGMMGTHDEAAKKFFQNTKVTLRLAPMLGDDKNNLHQTAGKVVMFTHHQKLVIVDTPQVESSGKRELLAFVGGVDLTNGRYDTNEHPLFRTLTTAHKDDCHNACFSVDTAKVGPREPWHDIHCNVRGPGTLDVVLNFTERWKRQAHDAANDLVDLAELGLAAPPAYAGNDAWSTQLFRSIDARTAFFERVKTPANRGVEDIAGVHFEPVDRRHSGMRAMSMKGLSMTNLTQVITGTEPELHRAFSTHDTDSFHFDRNLELKKGRLIDASVHAGLIYHIRQAQHTVYIESQYFLSSSNMWGTSNKTKCGNLVAAELTLKICEKIEANEPFAAYIVIPMWPEGIPDSGAVQAILRFQTFTMESMYKRIAAALKRRKEAAKKKGTTVPDATPRDYLNFYTLANRETKEGDTSTDAPRPNSDEETLSKTRRHLIYVHSKMTIVDDAVAMIGSANINQRSLDGARDSEIVLGSWQPAHMATKESIAHGDIHGYRLHCWAGIMGCMEDIFRDPSSVECVRRVNEIAWENWRKFCEDEVQDMHSHLVPYPVTVSDDGSVKARTPKGFFPDTKAKITGSKTMLPELLTT